MCTVCGCGRARLEHAPGPDHGMGAPAAHDHGGGPVHAHPHAHGDGHDHAHGHSLAGERAHSHADDVIDFGNGVAGVSIAGLSQQRTVSIERDILLNLLSSPGSGKTSLLVRAITDLQDRWPMAVIEGDQQTSNDAERIRRTGAQAVQINTGKGCHLDAHMVGHALEQLPLPRGGVLFIENVGNLVCPAAFDLGEACKVVVLSVTEGEDKPLKYPDMFAAADLMLLNKADLLPHLDFDVDACLAAALRVNPRLQILTVSARTGEGLGAFYAWIEGRAAIASLPVLYPS